MLTVDPAIIVDMLKPMLNKVTRTFTVDDPLPIDVRIVAWRPHPLHANESVVVLESSEWPEDESPMVLTEVKAPTMRVHTGVGAMLALIAREGIEDLNTAEVLLMLNDLCEGNENAAETLRRIIAQSEVRDAVTR